MHRLSLHLYVPGFLICFKFDMNLEDANSLYKFFGCFRDSMKLKHEIFLQWNTNFFLQKGLGLLHFESFQIFTIYSKSSIYLHCIQLLWYKADKWQTHYIFGKKESRSLCCIFTCILNCKSEKSKLHLRIHF